MFVKNYDNTIGTLETIYKKYSDFESSLHSYILSYSIRKSLSPKSASEERLLYFDKKVSSNFDLLKEDVKFFREYFSANRIYLPEISSSFVGEKISKTESLFGLLRDYTDERYNTDLERRVEYGIESLNEIGIDVNKLGYESFAEDTILFIVHRVIQDDMKEIEKHYKEMSKIK